MDPQKRVTAMSFYASGVFLVISWGIFYRDSGIFLASLAAALLAAFIFWGSYVLVRWLYLSLK